MSNERHYVKIKADPLKMFIFAYFLAHLWDGSRCAVNERLKLWPGGNEYCNRVCIVRNAS